MKRRLLATVIFTTIVHYSNAQLYTNTGYGANYSVDGAYIGWNLSGGGGETSFINNIGGGNLGGFSFDNTTRTNTITHLMRILGNGYVGIGTSTPLQKLDVDGNVALTNSGSYVTGIFRSVAAGGTTYPGVYSYGGGLSFGTTGPLTFIGVDGNTEVARFSSTGNLGVGTTSPTNTLQLTAGGNVSGAGGSISLSANAVAPMFSIDGSLIGNGTSGDFGKVLFKTRLNGTSSLYTAMTLSNDGSLAIGTTESHGFKLAINGSAIAESVTVKSHGTWPDYVFKPAYILPSLSEVKTYIDKYQHLPDMPSEMEVTKEGLNVGDVMKIQTKKIEELTLYMIEKDKQVNELQSELSDLKRQIAAITKALNKN